MTRLITSAANPKVKRLVRLRTRRHREAERVFLIEGFRELARAEAAGARIHDLFVCEELFLGTNEPGLVDRIVASGARLHRLAPVPFRKAAYRDRPEGLLAVAPQFGTDLAGLFLPEDALVLVVEGIEKPGNLGTMLRTADAAGVAAVVVADPGTDVFNPNVVRASLGSLFTVPVAVGTSVEVMAWLREQRLETFVTSPSARSDHWASCYRGPAAVVVGSEQYGLTGDWLDGRYTAVRIPMGGTADSLNASTAAGIVLFEAIRQRTVQPPVDHGALPLDP